ncbi:hypothetical protein OXYTRIMIC_057 [Oxytricha trifallax]|uniref:Uncharacterized protein n=1 Tax=Oxytricha trifallax TaxID=1172189 RepID=A0A073HZL7_9SPIT|nr:hypothetical protein OXYTRIMIC_057 [Oxytricha trifallax]
MLTQLSLRITCLLNQSHHLLSKNSTNFQKLEINVIQILEPSYRIIFIFIISYQYKIQKSESQSVQLHSEPTTVSHLSSDFNNAWHPHCVLAALIRMVPQTSPSRNSRHWLPSWLGIIQRNKPQNPTVIIQTRFLMRKSGGSLWNVLIPDQ